MSIELQAHELYSAGVRKPRWQNKMGSQIPILNYLRHTLKTKTRLLYESHENSLHNLTKCTAL